MQILRHRANDIAVFRRTLAAGFGAEIDIRDLGRGLVVSHGLPAERAPGLERFFEACARLKAPPPLALNIKSCGLQARLLSLLAKFGIKNYFVFDMAVPDAVDYLKLGAAAFTRQSEYERVPAFYEEARGVWLDEFRKSWIQAGVIKGHLARKKLVCVVSPELHRRAFRPAWRELKRTEAQAGGGRLMLCTDHPLEADKYFNGRD